MLYLETTMTEPEKPATPETVEITPKAAGQLTVLNAVLDRIGNITGASSAELRSLGLPAPTAEEELASTMDRLKALHSNMSAATVRLTKGETLPVISEGVDMIDLKYTNYAVLSAPPVTNNPTSPKS